MIKSLLILVLTLALLAGAALSRPSADDFKHFAHDRIEAKSSGWEKFTVDASTDNYLKSVTISNRFFWTDVSRDGKPEFTGAFAHWFDRNKADKPIDNPAK